MLQRRRKLQRRSELRAVLRAEATDIEPSSLSVASGPAVQPKTGRKVATRLAGRTGKVVVIRRPDAAEDTVKGEIILPVRLHPRGNVGVADTGAKGIPHAHDEIVSDLDLDRSNIRSAIGGARFRRDAELRPPGRVARIRDVDLGAGAGAA